MDTVALRDRVAPGDAASAGSGYALAVDIGGTFTDVVLRDGQGATWVDKTLTTHGDLLDGYFTAVNQALAKAGIGADAVDDVLVHATTVVTNALIERKGPPTALLVTEGFRDVLVIRDEHRFDMYDPQIEFPAPLVPPELTFAVSERIRGNGEVLKPVDPQSVEDLIPSLREKGIKSIAVNFLNAYKNSVNEDAVREVFERVAPDIYISLSSDVAPQIREYLRASTTAVNAYTQPITRPYLAALVERLAGDGFPNKPLIMLSSGGIVGAEIAGRYPVRMIESGPAAGALVAGYFADQLGVDDLMAFDMGGTTAKACLIQNREPLVTGFFEVDRRYRFQPGSGYPVTVPSIDLVEIGAGGGSIAWADNLGLLKVGPRSAGSEPGPVCYGRGGTEPTVTDANVVLGLLSAENFLGGDMRLDAAGAAAAYDTLGRTLGISGQEAALGVYRVVGENMAAAVRAHATDRGIDPRGIPVLAFGGAGPVHACYVAELLDSGRVIFPPMASVLSAFGCLVSPVRLDLVRSSIGRLGDLDWDDVARQIESMEDEGRAALAEAGIAAADVRFSYAADMRYFGQANEAGVPLGESPLEHKDDSTLRAGFEREYNKLYGVTLADVAVEVVTWRVQARGPATPRDSRADLGKDPAAPTDHRNVIFEHGTAETAVYTRSDIPEGQDIPGPAVIEERETTIVIPPDWTATVDGMGCVVAKRST